MKHFHLILAVDIFLLSECKRAKALVPVLFFYSLTQVYYIGSVSRAHTLNITIGVVKILRNRIIASTFFLPNSIHSSKCNFVSSKRRHACNSHVIYNNMFTKQTILCILDDDSYRRCARRIIIGMNGA